MLTVQGMLDELGLSLAAGKESAEAPIRWVHISELLDPTPWMSGGELLLTTGIQLTGPDEQRAFVRRLVDHHVAGVGFGVGIEHETIPQAMVEEADRHGFALFEVPYEMPFIAITEKAFGRLVNEQYEVLQRGIAVHRRLEQLVLEQRGLGEVAKALSAAIGGAVVLLDPHGAPMASATFRREIPAAALEAIRAEVNERNEAGTRRGLRAGPRRGRGPLARAAGRGRAARAARVDRRDPRRWRPGRVRAPDPPAGGHGGGARADAPPGRARHGAPARRRRARRGGRGRAGRGRAARPAASLRDRGPGRGARVQGLGARRARRRRWSASSARRGRRGWSQRGASCCARSWTARRETRWSWRRGCAPRWPRSTAPCAPPAAGWPTPARCGAASTRRATRWRPPRCSTAARPRSPRGRTSARSSSCSRCRTTRRCASTPTACWARSKAARASTAASCCARWRRSSSTTASGSAPRAQLFCHRHTLRYRIRRVEQLTGRDLSSARDRIEFWLALKARELVT